MNLDHLLALIKLRAQKSYLIKGHRLYNNYRMESKQILFKLRKIKAFLKINLDSRKKAN
jgi:hypothetical protein